MWYYHGEVLLLRTIGPKVSIVIPVARNAFFLREAINSALAQTYPNIEVIVVSDGSCNLTKIENITKKYNNRIIYYHHRYKSVASSLNVGIKHMTGDYFSWMRSDEAYAATKIETQMEAIYQFGRQAVIYSNVGEIDSLGNWCEIADDRLPDPFFMRCMLACRNKEMNGSTLLIPRSFLDRCGEFRPDLLYTADYEHWFRMARDVPFIYVPETLVFGRRYRTEHVSTDVAARADELDCVQSRMVNSLTIEEIGLYCNHSVSTFIEQLNPIFSQKQRYVRTISRLAKQMCLLADRTGEWDQASAFLDNLIQLDGGPSEIRRLWIQYGYTPQAASEKKPRVIVFKDGWIKGGAPRLLAGLIEALHRKYDWVVVSRVVDEDAFPIEPWATHIKPGNGLDLSLGFAVLVALTDADLFIGTSNYLEEALKIYKFLEALGIRSIACDFGHYFFPYTMQSLFPLIDTRFTAYSQANAVMWISRYSANLYAALQQNGLYMPVPNSFSIQPQCAPKTNKTLLAVGRFDDPHKRLDRILAVFARVLRDHPDAELVVVGPYDFNIQANAETPETVQQVWDRLNMPKDRIHFAGKQSNVEGYYNHASVLILTSDSEGSGVVLNEAGMFGLPCVVHEISGLEDVISDGENGFIAPYGNEEAMADKVSLLFSDPDLRNRMGRRANELISRFDRDLIFERWSRLIDTVLEQADQDGINRVLASQFMEPIQDRGIFAKQAAREYERNIFKVMHSNDVFSPRGTNGIAAVADSVAAADETELLQLARAETEAYTQALQELTGSLSWRVTKPLRWGKKLFASLRNDGAIATGRKVSDKLHRKMASVLKTVEPYAGSVASPPAHDHAAAVLPTENEIDRLIERLRCVKWEEGPEPSDVAQIKKICRNSESSEQIDNAVHLLNQTIFQAADVERTASLLKDVIQPLIESDRGKPVIMVHLYGWNYGGAERLTSLLANYMVRKYKIVLTMFEPFKECGYWIHSDVAVVRFYGTDRAVPRLQLLAGLMLPDLFIGNNNCFEQLAATYSVLRRMGIATIAYNLEYYFFPYFRQNIFMKNALTRNAKLAAADVSMFLTRFSAHMYAMHCSNAAVMPAANTYAVQTYNPDKSAGKTILALGRFNDPIKRLDRVVKVFAKVLPHHSDARLIVVGPYDLSKPIPQHEEETVGELIDRLGIPADRIEFAGLQSRPNEFYAKADVFMLTSDSEGFGLVLIEAGSYGLPVVLFDIPGLDDIVKEGENGYIVPQDDITGMAAKICGLFDNPGQWRNMAHRSLELAERFSIEQIGAKWERLIDFLLLKPPQEEINEFLSEFYMEKVQDYASLVGPLIREYEKVAMRAGREWKRRTGIPE